MSQLKIGILPLFLKLYDDFSGDFRPRLETFIGSIKDAFEARGIQVERSPICRIESEFAAAIQGFETSGIDAIVTLHLAYSPSLESSAALARTKLPVLVLDTTPTWSYGPSQDPAELMYNHGIHGVQDMCNLLLRNGKGFAIEAGHWEKSRVIDRIIDRLPAARAAAIMGRGAVGMVGTAFKGMGDFAMTPERLAATIGGRVKQFDATLLPRLLSSVTQGEIEAEMDEDKRSFDAASISPEVHARSVRLGLALRRWMKDEGLVAFTFNFQDMVKNDGYPTLPFLEASKAMARGQGYAGEGDVTTALLTAAVASIHPETTFTEMFCPDWENGRVFLSHMGEMNWRLVEGRPTLREMEYRFGNADNPAFLTGRFREGNIVLVNLAPTSDTHYRLILSRATMLPIEGEDRMAASVRGWFKPNLPLDDFLAGYSKLGGTHHLALAYTDSLAALRDLAMHLGWEVAELG